jgi:UDP-glucose 4-epimerase
MGKIKVLVTGNAGYIGSHLCKILNNRNELEIYGLDKTDPLVEIYDNSKFNIIANEDWPYSDLEFDCVLHLAAEVAVGRSVLDPTLYYLTNTLGTLNVLQNIKFKRFSLASTGAAAGLGSPYGISKRMAEDIVKQYCEINSIPFTIFRFYNVIGSDGIDPTNPDGLFYNLIKAKETGIFKLFGDDYNTRDGSCDRDYTHVIEICKAVEKSIEKSTNKIENLGHGVGTTVKEMIEIFKEVNNCEFRVIVDPRREGDLEKSVLDNTSTFMEKKYTFSELLKIQ